ncbi:uncharacterized protein LOC117099941 [Anneissia japonica]|uniref:uncharacterized protein LOC117099941 n=1 Tax=Anneissia japonica TaxID=1529436 RepID=UPI001425AD97|nr:uncharacterized protein LOC117099941 [Anneissia japonica]
MEERKEITNENQAQGEGINVGGRTEAGYPIQEEGIGLNRVMSSRCTYAVEEVKYGMHKIMLETDVTRELIGGITGSHRTNEYNIVGLFYTDPCTYPVQEEGDSRYESECQEVEDQVKGTVIFVDDRLSIEESQS